MIGDDITEKSRASGYDKIINRYGGIVMGIFDFWKQPDINQGVNEYLHSKGARLLDVRTPAEYMQGHIPGSMNLPLHNLEEVEYLLKDKEEPLYVYCHSGARSRQAVSQLQQMGYSNVKNIGGIAAYTGKVVA